MQRVRTLEGNMAEQRLWLLPRRFQSLILVRNVRFCSNLFRMDQFTVEIVGQRNDHRDLDSALRFRNVIGKEITIKGMVRKIDQNDRGDSYGSCQEESRA